MPSWTRKTVVPGDQLTVEIQHSNRSALRPLIGLLRTVEILDDARAVILNEDGTRYAVHGRRLPPLAPVEVAIFTDPTTGALWAHVYDLPPREHSPYPLPPRYAAVAQPDGQGGIARLSSCWCGNGCVCPTCGEQTVEIPNRGLEWSTCAPSYGRHSLVRCAPTSCTTTTPAASWDGPECCALPMRLAPIAWVCNRESGHQRPYQWPKHTTSNL